MYVGSHSNKADAQQHGDKLLSVGSENKIKPTVNYSHLINYLNWFLNWSPCKLETILEFLGD